MTKQADKELKALEMSAADAQAAYDASRSAVEGGEVYTKSLEAEYREALVDPTDFDRLTDLQAKRNAIGPVRDDLRAALDVAEKAKDDADERLRHETNLRRSLGELSPKAQALVQAWQKGTLPSRVRLATGDYPLHSLVNEYVVELRRGRVERVRRELENVAQHADLSE